MFNLTSKLLGLLPRLPTSYAAFKPTPSAAATSAAVGGSPQQQVQPSRGLISGANEDIFKYKGKNRFRPDRSKHKRMAKKPVFGERAFEDKPFQKPEEWDGFGRYKVSGHNYPTHKVHRDVLKRRILKQHAEERLLINTIRKADILPKDIRRIADQEIHTVPRDSAITRVNRRCAITGRARGVFHQFRIELADHVS